MTGESADSTPPFLVHRRSHCHTEDFVERPENVDGLIEKESEVLSMTESSVVPPVEEAPQTVSSATTSPTLDEVSGVASPGSTAPLITNPNSSQHRSLAASEKNAVPEPKTQEIEPDDVCICFLPLLNGRSTDTIRMLFL